MDIDEATRVSLLERLRDNPADQQAWGDFVDRYGPKIYAWCRRWQLQDADAEDVTQQLLTKLVRKLSQFTYDPSRGRFRSWLKTATHHAWQDYVDGRKRDDGSGDTGVLEKLHSLPARDDLLEQLRSQFDLELFELAKDRVQARVAPHTWEAFRLLEDDGADVEAVAQAIGLRVAMVYVARSKVKKMLREEIERLDDEVD